MASSAKVRVEAAAAAAVALLTPIEVAYDATPAAAAATTGADGRTRLPTTAADADVDAAAVREAVTRAPNMLDFSLGGEENLKSRKTREHKSRKAEIAKHSPAVWARSTHCGPILGPDNR